MKEHRRYGSQQRIADSDQQHERIRWGDGKQPSPFSYPEELGKEVMPENKKAGESKTRHAALFKRKKEAKIVEEKSVTQAVPAARSRALTAGAVLSIVTGAIGVIVGVLTIGYYGLGIIFLALGSVSILGGAYALERKNYGWALAGAICACVPTWILGVPAIVLIAQSRKEFA